MMAVSAISGTAPTPTKSGFAALGQGDFLKLMTVQLQSQDPFDPMDNKAMLAQMAQFSALSAANEGNATLDSIAAKLDALIAMQTAANPG